MSSDQHRNEPRFKPNPDATNIRFRDAEPISQPGVHSGRKKFLSAVVAIAALSGFAGVAWYATTQGQKNPGAVVPIIAADNSPIKERPADPGGLDVLNLVRAHITGQGGVHLVISDVALLFSLGDQLLHRCLVEVDQWSVFFVSFNFGSHKVRLVRFSVIFTGISSLTI